MAAGAEALGAGALVFVAGLTGAGAAFFSVMPAPFAKPLTRSNRLSFSGFCPALEPCGVRCAMDHLLHCVTGSKKTLVKSHERESCRAFLIIMSRLGSPGGQPRPRALLLVEGGLRGRLISSLGKKILQFLGDVISVGNLTIGSHER